MSEEHCQLLLHHRQKLVDLDPSDPEVIPFVRCTMENAPLDDGIPTLVCQFITCYNLACKLF